MVTIDDVKLFIIEHLDLIDTYKFTELYSLVSRMINNTAVGQLTQLLVNCRIKPDEYMTELPPHYAHHCLFKEYIINNNITSIGNNAFNACKNLRSISIPDSISSISDGMLSNCSSLASVNIPDSVTRIGDFAFQSCYSLTSISIPDSVMNIGVGAFNYCTGLTSVTIPNSVTSIGRHAFNWCTQLENISFEGTVAEWTTMSVAKDTFAAVPSRRIKCIDGVTKLRH